MGFERTLYDDLTGQMKVCFECHITIQTKVFGLARHKISITEMSPLSPTLLVNATEIRNALGRAQWMFSQGLMKLPS